MFSILPSCGLPVFFLMQLSSVTEERDMLKNIVDELKKKHQNSEVGADIAGGTLVQVVQLESYFCFYGIFLHKLSLVGLLLLQWQELESSLAKKEHCIKELECNLFEQKEICSRQHGEIKLLNEKLNGEARTIKSLERESDRLRSEISLLESKVCLLYSSITCQRCFFLLYISLPFIY